MKTTSEVWINVLAMVSIRYTSSAALSSLTILQCWPFHTDVSITSVELQHQSEGRGCIEAEFKMVKYSESILSCCCWHPMDSNLCPRHHSKFKLGFHGCWCHLSPSNGSNDDILLKCLITGKKLSKMLGKKKAVCRTELLKA